MKIDTKELKKYLPNNLKFYIERVETFARLKNSNKKLVSLEKNKVKND